MFRTDDPVADFEAWDAMRERRLERFPVCSECGDPIQDDFAFRIDQRWICELCMGQFRREVMPVDII